MASSAVEVVIGDVVVRVGGDIASSHLAKRHTDRDGGIRQFHRR
ncbi:hypothetical protein SS05631_a46870 (plasmid) [Sinorhizobium sp. CCBAU 05631]|nr:hypothetical protein SS05631_a46870 [Sinorhizobium sp. CCBAU 05631]